MKASLIDRLAQKLEELGYWEIKGLPDTLLPELESAETRQALAEVIIAVLDRWEVHVDNQAELLGRRDMGPILREKELPFDADLLQRVGNLLGIERALKTLYPYTPTARDQWVWQPNESLDGLPPLQVMLEEGLLGIRRVRKLLESQVRTGQA